MEVIRGNRFALLICLIAIAAFAIDTVYCRSHSLDLHRGQRNLEKREADNWDSGDELALADDNFGDLQNDEDGELDDDDLDSSEAEEPYTGPPPIIRSASRNVTVNRGETVWLPCETVHAETFVVLWSKGQDILYQGEFKTTQSDRIMQYGNKTISITNVGPGDNGVYTCSVAGANGPTPTVTYIVQFHRAPNVSRILPEGSGRLVREGDSLEIRCETTGVPRPKLSWSKKGQRLTKEDVEYGDQSILIKRVTKEHSGIYQCLASNGVGQPAHGAVDIKVLYAPQVHIRKTVVNTAEGFETELSCGVHSEPGSIIQWTKDGQIIENTGATRITTHGNGQHSNLRILQVRPGDFGKYTCTAQNQYGDDSKSVRVIPQPALAEFIQRTTAEDGVSPVLEWEIDSNQPLQHVELKYRRIDESQPQRPPTEDDWIIVQPKFEKPNEGAPYKVKHILRDLQPGKYEARIKSKNTQGWSDISDGHVFDGDFETNEIRQREYEEAPIGEVHASASARLLSSLTILLSIACFLVRIA